MKTEKTIQPTSGYLMLLISFVLLAAGIEYLHCLEIIRVRSNNPDFSGRILFLSRKKYLREHTIWKLPNSKSTTNKAILS